MLISYFLGFAFLNFLLNFYAMLWMQNTECNPRVSQPTSGDCNVDNIVEPLLVMRQTFGWGVSYAHNN